MSGFRRALAALGCALLLSGFAPAALAAPGKPVPVDTPQRLAVPVARSMTLLCSGYTACANKGMGNGGYQAVNNQMFWRMYSGHNCTNYAAYRMVHSGLPNSRPWSGEGNASNWGHAMSSITDGVPTVGAVAWYDKYVRPAGSAGHVAYVERVISPDEIIISQDSWGGDFSWARVTRSGGSWPSGFVHFNDLTLRNVARPAVTGLAKVGARLTASAGSWTPENASTTYSYQWRAGGVDIAGATAPSLRLTAAQQGKRVTVRVTASRPGYPARAVWSGPTAVVLPGVLSNGTPPEVTADGGGEATVDHPLSVSTGAWTPAPDQLAYQWYADGVMLEGQIGSTYTPGAAQLGQALTVTVTASRQGYDPVTVSSAPVTVQPATFVVKATPTLQGVPRLGESLTFDPGSWSPTAPGDVTVTWLRDGAPIEGALQTTYALTPDDLGHRIAAQMTVVRPGYTNLVQTTAPTLRVKTRPTMRLDATRPGRGRLKVALTVRAPGAGVAPGTVVLTSHGKVLAELTLRDGSATTTLDGLPAGPMTMRLRYQGTRWITRTVFTRTVVIR